MNITLVKKILKDGSPCPKCADVLQKLEASGHMDRIDRIIVADERDPDSPGMTLAHQLQVDRAPFFVVEREGQAPEIYTVYLKFVREVLEQETRESDELKEIMKDNPDLDFL
ncbi:hypothetical protein [Marinimicrobium sp. ARAG 43.8]|uniref:hypothetical protein n=1 Tax=Marinimicrobium sp. ARAG 43.8 TaxID=3418719 RepID=UPI003CF87A10